MKLTQPITSNGVLVDRDGNEVHVPTCEWGPPTYPMPSECNAWIKLFKNLRDHFTDEEIDKINSDNWNKAQEEVR